MNIKCNIKLFLDKTINLNSIILLYSTYIFIYLRSNNKDCGYFVENCTL